MPSAWSAANSRGSDSIAASSAATQTTPAAIARSWFGSGADAEREQARDDDEEHQHVQHVALAPQRDQQVAPQDVRAKPVHRQLELAGGAGDAIGTSWCEVSTSIPPTRVRGAQPLSCAMRLGIERRERLVEQPQRNAAESASRASAARRRWPCDR